MIRNLLIIAGVTAIVVMIVKLYVDATDPEVIDGEEALAVEKETPLEHVHAVLEEHKKTNFERPPPEDDFYIQP